MTETSMQTARIIGCRIVVGLVIAGMASALYFVLERSGVFDAYSGPMPLMASAQKCLERGDFESALTFANRAVQCRPDWSATYHVRGEVREARGEFREAIQDYSMVVSQNYYLALADRGRVYEKMGDVDRAAADFCDAIRKSRFDSRRFGDVRAVALRRLMGPGDYNIDMHPDAVDSLLQFFNEAIERDADDLKLLECRDLILQSEAR